MTTRPATPPDVRMSAQTPQTDAFIASQEAAEVSIWAALMNIQEHARTLEADRDLLKALCEELREALNGTLNLIDNGWLVRNTTEDGTSGWALRQVEPIKRLQEARAALKKAEKDI